MKKSLSFTFFPDSKKAFFRWNSFELVSGEIFFQLENQIFSPAKIFALDESKTLIEFESSNLKVN